MLQDLSDALRGSLPGKIALIAPAGAVAPADLEQSIHRLAQAGVSSHATRHVTARHRYLAGDIQARLADLYEAFELPEVRAVWCVRGGYGSAQLLPHIDWDRLHTRIPLIGYSDISALITAFHRRGLPAIHGPVAVEIARDCHDSAQQAQRHASLHSVGAALAGQTMMQPLEHVCGSRATVSGPLIGGNLTTLASLAGTTHALYVPDGAILLLEDVGEPYYRLERSFWQLLGSIDTTRLSAICLGTFTQCPRLDVPHSIEAIFTEWVTPLDVPLYCGAPFGHGALNHAWPCGRQAMISDSTLRW